MEPRRLFEDLKRDCASMIQAVNEGGFVPWVNYADYNWTDRRTPTEMADYMLRNYFSEAENRDALRREIVKLAVSHAGADGTVSDNVNTRVCWIYWRTEKQR